MLHRPSPPPSTPAWIVCGWPPVTCQAARAPDLRLVHLGTQVLDMGNSGGPSTGQTLWGFPSGNNTAGVAWDWVQIQEGVFAMADPFGLVTNLHLIGAQGQALTNIEATIRLNELVHTLPWQSEVQRALARTEH